MSLMANAPQSLTNSLFISLINIILPKNIFHSLAPDSGSSRQLLNPTANNFVIVAI